MPRKIYNTDVGVKLFYGLDPGVDQIGYSQTDLPIEYLVSIEDKRPKAYIKDRGKKIVLIKAPLQEQVTTKTEATWSTLSAAALAQGFTQLTGLLTGRTLVNRYANRAFWSGTTPLNFTLNLKFEAINDVKKEVLRPIIELQRMSLPFSGLSSGEEEVAGWKKLLANSFLAPPGPDPFVVGGKSFRKRIPFVGELKGSNEEITIRIGSLLEIKRAVVKSIQIQHPPKFDVNGLPIEAIATVQFQTFEIIIKETLDDLYPGGTTVSAESLMTSSKWKEKWLSGSKVW